MTCFQILMATIIICNSLLPIDMIQDRARVSHTHTFNTEKIHTDNLIHNAKGTIKTIKNRYSIQIVSKH